jgi:hypothetical protein
VVVVNGREFEKRAEEMRCLHHICYRWCNDDGFLGEMEGKATRVCYSLSFVNVELERGGEKSTSV